VVFDFMTKTETKHCHKCDTTKTVDQFSKHRSKKDGQQSHCKACEKAYREANREKIASRHKSYREANREDLLAYQKSYYEANREDLIASNLKYRLNRLANDPIFRQIDNTRCHLRDILHGRRSHQPTLDLLDCTRQEWRDHLESLWTEGMSWDNYGNGEGQWCVDHVIPVSSFDHTDPEQRKECWGWRNTQPLWAADNAVKGSKLPTE